VLGSDLPALFLSNSSFICDAHSKKLLEELLTKKANAVVIGSKSTPREFSSYIFKLLLEGYSSDRALFNEKLKSFVPPAIQEGLRYSVPSVPVIISLLGGKQFFKVPRHLQSFVIPADANDAAKSSFLEKQQNKYFNNKVKQMFLKAIKYHNSSTILIKEAKANNKVFKQTMKLKNKNFCCVRPLAYSSNKQYFKYLVIMINNNGVYHFLASKAELIMAFPKKVHMTTDVKTSKHLVNLSIDTSYLTLVASAQTPCILVYFIFELLFNANHNSLRLFSNSVFAYLSVYHRKLLLYPKAHAENPEYNADSKRKLLICLLGSKKFLLENRRVFFLEESIIRGQALVRFYKTTKQ
jgi:hypothetical protein